MEIIMNSFVNAVNTVPVKTRTENGMVAQESTMSAVVDFFYNVGALRASGRNVIPYFVKAYVQDADMALRIAQWARDVRGGAGERKIFRDILVYLEKNERDVLLNTNFLSNVPKIGRWDDLLVFTDTEVRNKAFGLIKIALDEGNGLCSKWLPRQGEIAAQLRTYMGMTPKQWRKTLVSLTNVVETAMCSKNYEDVNYSHVPSVAMSRYMKAFSRNDADRFVAFRNSLVRGETKINASAVYPYNVIQSLRSGGDVQVNNAQWNALPDYITDANILPMVDVSGSMSCSAGGKGDVTCLDVALSLGLYCADKNKGAFKDLFLTFSGDPELLKLKGTLSQKLNQMNSSDWGMNTNLEAAFGKILETAKAGQVTQEDMPSIVLILSDMEFDTSIRNWNDHAIQMIEREYEEAGYKAPAVVFWNLNSRNGHAPVSYDKKGVALVSGFSPSIMKSILSSADMSSLNAIVVVEDAVMIDRYNYLAYPTCVRIGWAI